ncbi:protein containing PEP-CTERM bacterial domain [Rhodopirellula baltica WH47]|uniref:Protein containing PEP-CTERM bacterial domain n=1 Tax=Rhodopirellula baltica WH47 TaxID=991778 RepID=F2AWI2_RHOBT|nr:protein containing PEP-CTERM bacterial domain [Rhodopirellula baltica WH47]
MKLDAAITYSLDAVPDSGAFTSGQTISLQLILRENDDGLGGNPSTSLVNGDGLFGFAARLERTTGDAILSNFELADGFSASLGPNPTPNPTETPALWEFNFQSSNPLGDSPGFGTSLTSFVVGTVDVTFGALATTFTTGNLSNPLPNNIGIGQNVANFRSDSITTYGNASFDVTAVPEPSSLALVGVACSAFVLRHCRRKRRCVVLPQKLI